MSGRISLQAIKQEPGIKLLTPWTMVGFTGNSRGSEGHEIMIIIITVANTSTEPGTTL